MYVTLYHSAQPAGPVQQPRPQVLAREGQFGQERRGRPRDRAQQDRLRREDRQQGRRVGPSTRRGTPAVLCCGMTLVPSSHSGR